MLIKKLSYQLTVVLEMTSQNAIDKSRHGQILPCRCAHQSANTTMNRYIDV